MGFLASMVTGGIIYRNEVAKYTSKASELLVGFVDDKTAAPDSAVARYRKSLEVSQQIRSR